jgi:hypothetical protein
MRKNPDMTVQFQGFGVRRDVEGNDEGPDLHSPHHQRIAWELTGHDDAGGRLVRVEITGGASAYLRLADLVAVTDGFEQLARVQA